MSRALALTVLMMLVPFTAMADHDHDNDYQAKSLASELAYTLELIASDAGYQAEQAKRYGHYAEAKALGDLASTAANLENKVFRSVIVPLNQGTANNVVKAQLQRLASSFSFLERNGYEAGRYSYQLARDAREALYLKSELLEVLSASDRGRPGRPGRPVR